LITLSNLKSYLKWKLMDKWYMSKSNINNMSLRESLLQNKTSNLKQRINILRQLQILFSRYRYDRSESVRKYLWKLNTVLNPACQLYNYPKESVYYLLESYSGTLQYWN